MINRTSLSGAVLLSLTALVMVWGAMTLLPIISGVGRGLRELLLLSGVVFGMAGLTCWLDWIAWRISIRLGDVRRAMAITKAVVLADAVRLLTPEQLEYVRDHEAIDVQIRLGVKGFYYRLQCSNGTYIPLDEVVNLLEAMAPNHPSLMPIRSLGNGSLRQGYLRAFTETMVAHGWAEPARGNHPAQWKPGLSAAVVLDKLLGEDEEE